VAARMIKEGEAQAFVCAGNTGALHQVAALEIGRIKGIRRSALAAVFPTRPTESLALDVGANADCKPEYLVQFATMGSINAEKVFGDTVAYCSSKGAIHAMTRAMSLALAPFSIRVNTLAPGAVADTDLEPERWQRAAGRELQRDAGKQHAVTAAAGQILCREAARLHGFAA